MSMEYAENRIREALKLAKGNVNKARQQVMAWTYEDKRLMEELTRQHLPSIVAYNIERVASGRADESKNGIKIPNAPPAKAGKKEENFGLEILKAVANANPSFGLEDPGAPRRRTQASESHIKAIEALAAKSKTPPKK